MSKIPWIEFKHIKRASKYKYVQKRVGPHGEIKWAAVIGGHSIFFDEEKAAAIFVDKFLIKQHKAPINVLKPLKD